MSKEHQLPGPALVDREALIETMMEAYGPLHWAVDPTQTSPAMLEGIRRAINVLREELDDATQRIKELEGIGG